MTVTLSSAEQALKEVYLGVVANQLNINANPLLAKIKHATSDIWGKEIIKAAPWGINGGIGAGSETGTLPNAAGNNYAQFKSSLKNLYGKIEISDKALRVSENNSATFVNFLNDEMEGLLKASSFNLGRMLYGDGTGLLATTTAAFASGTDIVVDDARNIVEGMMIDIYSGTTKVKEAVRVVYVDRPNKTITINASHTGDSIASGAKIYVQGSKGFEITGLEAIFGNGDLYGLSRSTYKWLVPYTDSTEQEISDNLLQTTIDALEDKAGSEVNFISCARDVRRAYQQFLTFYKRNVDIAELAGGQKAITFNGIPVVADRFVANGTAYLLNTDDFVMHELCDWKWLESEDGRILRQTPGYPIYTATLVKYADVICGRPAGQAKLSNIKSTVTNPLAEYITINTTTSNTDTNTDAGSDSDSGSTETTSDETTNDGN